MFIHKLRIYLKHEVRTMSVLRDAMELGYGTNHFMVTGENFPSNWNDPIEKESSYDDDDENCITSLDTAEGWFKRNRFILNTEKDIGAIDGESYYHFNQTMTLDQFLKASHSNISEKLEAYFSCLKENDFTETSSSLFYLIKGIKDEISNDFEHVHNTVKEKYDLKQYEFRKL